MCVCNRRFASICNVSFVTTDNIFPLSIYVVF